VLRGALKRTKKIGLGQLVMRGRGYVAWLKPCGKGLVLEHFAMRTSSEKAIRLHPMCPKTYGAGNIDKAGLVDLERPVSCRSPGDHARHSRRSAACHSANREKLVSHCTRYVGGSSPMPTWAPSEASPLGKTTLSLFADGKRTVSHHRQRPQAPMTQSFKTPAQA
jgi:hypothetical protein